MAAEKIFNADFRNRPPQMVVDGDKFSGPLKDILEEASSKIGYTVKWRKAPFKRSLEGLKMALSILFLDIVKPQTEKYLLTI